VIVRPLIARLFLGRWWHWAVLASVWGALWLAGAERLHVIHFNAFVWLLLIGTAVILGLLLALTSPGEQVTRDPLERDDKD